MTLENKLLNIQNKILIQSVKKFGPTNEAKLYAIEELKKQVPNIIRAALKLGIDLMKQPA